MKVKELHQALSDLVAMGAGDEEVKIVNNRSRSGLLDIRDLGTDGTQVVIHGVNV